MLRRDEEGVASTVSTLFSLIVVLMFMSAALSYEDVRQAESEWTLLREAETSFGILRTVHDLQFAAGLDPGVIPGGLPDGGVAVVLPVGMATTSPFQRPVVGRVVCETTQEVASVAFSYRAGIGVFDAVEVSGGTLSLELRTHRIPGARIQWENGATILAQGPNAVVLDYPYFRIEPLPEGIGVVYRAVRLVDDRWSLESTGPQFLTLRALGAESYTLEVAGGGEAHLDEVQQFVYDLAREIYDASTDGSDRVTGSYADVGIDTPAPPNNPNPGILNQGLKEQLDYYNAALAKQQSGDCTNAANEMNASARQLLTNTMDKILLGIDEGYIDSAWGLDLHTRLGTLLRCLDEMTESLQSTCEFSCLSLFGGGGGRLEFLISSDYRAAWGLWYGEYLASAGPDSVDEDDWEDKWQVIPMATFVLIQIDNVQHITFEVAYVTFADARWA